MILYRPQMSGNNFYQPNFSKTNCRHLRKANNLNNFLPKTTWTKQKLTRFPILFIKQHVKERFAYLTPEICKAKVEHIRIPDFSTNANKLISKHLRLLLRTIAF